MCGWLDVPLTSGGRTPEPASLQLYGIRVDPVCAQQNLADGLDQDRLSQNDF